ncbi:hypothetical protein GA0070216_13228 [Micromonospora matsumotoense]|uniref:Pyridine nucleotide-disulphide oxidoreductase n=1 Tax=Micromonospora matsumotoense TaxID=121616 RepID=A0A1C5AVB5_9ACTN|nr:hypothetical protein GA0070216_13228 [Micromonospora matsumotoense]
MYAARANLRPLVTEGVQSGGALMTTTEVENFPGHPGGIRGPEQMDPIRKQAENVGAEFITDDVTRVDLTGALARPSAGVGHGTCKPGPRISLAGVAARVQTATTGDSRADAYLDVPDRALADHVLSHAEVAALVEVARTWGLSGGRVHLLHQ